MSAHSTLHHSPELFQSRPAARMGAVRSELLRLAAVAVLAGNFVLGAYERSSVHSVLIWGYLAVTLLSLFLTIRLPAAG